MNKIEEEEIEKEIKINLRNMKQFILINYTDNDEEKELKITNKFIMEIIKILYDEKMIDSEIKKNLLDFNNVEYIYHIGKMKKTNKKMIFTQENINNLQLNTKFFQHLPLLNYQKQPVSARPIQKVILVVFAAR